MTDDATRVDNTDARDAKVSLARYSQDDSGTMQKDPRGAWVMYGDYLALQASLAIEQELSERLMSGSDNEALCSLGDQLLSLRSAQ